jgi:hypothetical protein
MKALKIIPMFSLVFLIGQNLGGQSYRVFQDELDNIRNNIRLSFGPFKIQPLLQLRDLGYDDNIYFESRPISDYTGTLSPEVRVFLPFRNYLILSFRDNPEYVYYLKESRRRVFTNSYGFGAKLLFLHRFVLSGDYHYDEHRQRLSSELGHLVTDISQGYSLGLFYETARKTSLGFTGFINYLKYGDIETAAGEIPLSRILNRQERGGTMEFYYRLFWDGYFFVSAGYTEFQFESAESSWRDAYSYQGYMGIRFPLTGGVRGTLSLGYKKFMPRAEGRKRFSGLVGKTELSARFGRIGLRLNYGRDNVFSYWEDVFYFIEDRVASGLSYYLTTFLRLDYNYEYSTANYPEFSAVDTATGEPTRIRRVDKHQTHSVGLVFRVYRNMGLGLTWNLAQWTSDLPGWNRKKTFVGVNLIYQF